MKLRKRSLAGRGGADRGSCSLAGMRGGIRGIDRIGDGFEGNREAAPQGMRAPAPAGGVAPWTWSRP
ncbi:30S ribosomal protein S6 (fragment) [Methanoculleus bourgensis]|uniref:30S ribosomal protein S6 n=1 Tax=Methanoculleus bourgensis TaxID=83986 RepID=A0A0X3BIA1_9EURY